MKTDVAVVGASTTGLFAALGLARAGAGVTVYERNGELDPAPRTLIVTGRVADYLGEVGRRAVVNEIRGFELFADGRVATVNLHRPDLVVERSILIRSLAERAAAAGARVEFGHRFTTLKPGSAGTRVAVSTASGDSFETEFRAVIGADGTASRVARAGGWPRQSSVPLVQAIVRLPADLSPQVTRIWFRPEDTPFFYWLIPESEDRGALGLIGAEPQTARRYLDSFLAEKGFEPLAYQAALIPAYSGWSAVRKRIGRGHAYLVGDAAGHVKVSTVGGLVTGFRGVKGVVETILRGRQSPELRRLRSELEAHRLLRAVLHRFTQDDYVRLIDLLDERMHSTLGRVTRDEAPRLLWQVVRARPRIGLLALRALVLGSRQLDAGSAFSDGAVAESSLRDGTDLPTG